jgi:hypothetical protein
MKALDSIDIQKDLTTAKDQMQKVVSELNVKNVESKTMALLYLFQQYGELATLYEQTVRNK